MNSPLALRIVLLIIAAGVVTLGCDAAAQAQTPVPAQCPYTFADAFPDGASCGYAGPFNADAACPNDLGALLLSNGSFVVAGMATDPAITFGAHVDSAASATLLAYFVGTDLTPHSITGVMQLQQSGHVLVIAPDTPPFTIAGCSFVQYTGTFTQAFAATPTPTATPLMVSGHIRYYSNGLPVGAATVQLQGPTPGSTQTDDTGFFAFSQVGAGGWQLVPQKNGDAGTAVRAADAVFALQTAVGMRTLTMEQHLACDVSGDGVVNGLDAALILQYKVGKITRFPVAQTCMSDWVFVPTPAAGNPVLTQPMMTSGNCQHGAIAQPLGGPADSQDFTAILFGDCIGFWQPTPGATPTVP